MTYPWSAIHTCEITYIVVKHIACVFNMANNIFSPPKDVSELPQHSALHTIQSDVCMSPCSLQSLMFHLKTRITNHQYWPQICKLYQIWPIPRPNCAQWCVIASHHPSWSDVVGHAILCKSCPSRDEHWMI